MKEKYQLTELYKYYLDSPLRSVKHSSYFLTYENLLEKYRNKPIVFVEVGIHNGGSLFMWRKFFGDNARIIGIDLNPNAKELEKYGFEIFIGNQSENSFWKNFYKEVGKIDILLDDGGHTSEQQINTVNKSVDFINNGGMIIVEDTHTSYFRNFGYPSKYTFTKWAHKISDNINARSEKVSIKNPIFKDTIYSIEFFESIVSFKIDRTKCADSKPTSNNSETMNYEDYRYSRTRIERLLDLLISFENNYSSKKRNILLKILLKLNSIIYIYTQNIFNKYRTFKLRKLF